MIRVRFQYYLIYLVLLLSNKFLPNIFSSVKKRYLSHSGSRRVFSKSTFKSFSKTLEKYPLIYTVDLPAWPAVAINVNAWRQCVTVDRNFIFQLWANDIAMQFMNAGMHCAVARNLYLLNDQALKVKYGFSKSSSNAIAECKTQHVCEDGLHLKIFKEKWGFSYEDPRKDYLLVRARYINTLIDRYFHHDCRKGPLETIFRRSNTL